MSGPDERARESASELVFAEASRVSGDVAARRAHLVEAFRVAQSCGESDLMARAAMALPMGQGFGLEPGQADRRRLQYLVESLEASFADLTEAADASPPDDEHDPEGHTIAFERSRLSGQRETYLRNIAELTAAELRLDDARSALCDECGAPIPLERRLAVPTTTRCVDCARRDTPRRLGRA